MKQVVQYWNSESTIIWCFSSLRFRSALFVLYHVSTNFFLAPMLNTCHNLLSIYQLHAWLVLSVYIAKSETFSLQNYDWFRSLTRNPISLSICYDLSESGLRVVTVRGSSFPCLGFGPDNFHKNPCNSIIYHYILIQ